MRTLSRNRLETMSHAEVREYLDTPDLEGDRQTLERLEDMLKAVRAITPAALREALGDFEELVTARLDRVYVNIARSARVGQNG